MSRYPRLFEPLQVHGRKLINRVIMGSMHTGLEEGQHHFDHSLRNMAAFYEERARGGVGLIVTGGIAPNNAGRVAPLAAMMTTPSDAVRHREVTEAVHQHRDADGNGPMIAMQILHAGRYGYHPWNVSPSKAKAPIGWFTPSPLSGRDIERTIDDFVRAAALAEEAGYDGVEVMGSEGYLINQFLARQVNDRTDQWGGAFDNRMRLALRIVDGIRAVRTRPAPPSNLDPSAWRVGSEQQRAALLRLRLLCCRCSPTPPPHRTSRRVRRRRPTFSSSSGCRCSTWWSRCFYPSLHRTALTDFYSSF